MPLRLEITEEEIIEEETVEEETEQLLFGRTVTVGPVTYRDPGAPNDYDPSGMGLAEAVRLGSLLMRRRRAGSSETCAIGMALLAHDIRPDGGASDYQILLELYPWLDEPEIQSYCPQCGETLVSAEHLTHLFDQHVMTGEMSLDALCEFLAQAQHDAIEKLWARIDWDEDEVDRNFLRLTGLGGVQMATWEEICERYDVPDDAEKPLYLEERENREREWQRREAAYSAAVPLSIPSPACESIQSNSCSFIHRLRNPIPEALWHGTCSGCGNAPAELRSGRKLCSADAPIRNVRNLFSD
jgi:hypothetical protein